MMSLVNLLLLILILIFSISLGIGFDLRKPFNWLYVLCAFLIGPVAGITMGGIQQGISSGILFALLAIWVGPIMFRRRQQYKKYRK